MQGEEFPSTIFSERLAELLRLRNMTPAALARATGISSAAFSLILSGKRQDPGVTNAAKIASALGVSLDYLVGLSDTPAPHTIDAWRDPARTNLRR